MPLQLGLVGLPNVGKSTLFNALTRAGAAVASYPFTTIEPNIGVVAVPDERLARIAEIVKPQRSVPTALRVVDIAGLVKGAHRGEGLGNHFLSHIRTVDAIAMVVRCFEAEDIPHVTTYLDPVEDMETVELELILSDVELLERRLGQVQGQSKGDPRAHADELETIDLALAHLHEGRTLRSIELAPGQSEHLAAVDLLTMKPMLYVANVSEEELPTGGKLAAILRERVSAQDDETIALSAALESELTELEPSEAREYRAAVGLEAPGLERFIWAGYRLLDYVTFFTTTGGKEVRAWNLVRGGTALDAAGKIHTDMARGFIRAEVVHYDDLASSGSMAQARESGLLRAEGRDYVVRDGDVLHMRFNV